MLRSQQIIIREYVCTSLKLLSYLKNTKFKILYVFTTFKCFYVFLYILTLKSAF